MLCVHLRLQYRLLAMKSHQDYANTRNQLDSYQDAVNRNTKRFRELRELTESSEHSESSEITERVCTCNIDSQQ